jgi:transcriptional regulator with XRE-family HTH domain
MSEALGQLIARFRKAAQDNQETLANKVGRTKQWLGAIEKGKAIPTLEQLLRLHRELVSEDNQSSDSDLKTWLLKWLELRVENDAGPMKEIALGVVNQLYSRTPRAGKIRSTSAAPTLEDFPHGFQDLVVICGDRRESPPKRKGDFFVDSFSSADLASLKTLFDKTGPLEIRSDKFFAPGNLGDSEYLKQTYGRRNLIVLGSPAVNLLARAINKNCVFRFATSKRVRDFLKFWDEGFPEINDRKLRAIFWDMVSKRTGSPDSDEIDTKGYYEDSRSRGESRIHEDQITALARKVGELLKDQTVKDVQNSFHKFGFVDPIANKVQGFFLREDNDFGVISMGANPYSDGGNYFCILAAGIHAPGSDMAVRVLATDNFKDHPLGGVIEVNLDLEGRWSERFSNADFTWQTERYSLDDELMGRLRKPKPHSMLGKCEPADLKSLADFVERFIVSKPK